MKIINVYYNGNEHGKYLVIGNKISIGKGQWKGLMFSTYGLGLSRAECKFRECKRFKKSKFITIYFIKHFLSYSKEGYAEQFGNCKIQWEMKLHKYLMFKLKNWLEYDGKRKFEKIASKIMKTFFFTKQYNFTIARSYEKPVKIKSDILTAFQLAVNYEADLYQGNALLLSPLGLDWEENNESIQKHLGKIFKFNRLFGYADYNDVTKR